MPTDNGPTASQSAAIAADLKAIGDRIRSPEGLGRAVIEFALTNATTMGTLNGDILEIPAVATVSLPPPTPPMAADEPTGTFTEVETCHEVCISVLGHHLYCWTQCHTETHSTVLPG